MPRCRQEWGIDKSLSRPANAPEQHRSYSRSDNSGAHTQLGASSSLGSRRPSLAVQGPQMHRFWHCPQAAEGHWLGFWLGPECLRVHANWPVPTALGTGIRPTAHVRMPTVVSRLRVHTPATLSASPALGPVTPFPTGHLRLHGASADSSDLMGVGREHAQVLTQDSCLQPVPATAACRLPPGRMLGRGSSSRKLTAASRCGLPAGARAAAASSSPAE